MTAVPVVHSCGCEIPGSPCPDMVELKRDMDSKYSELLDALDALDALQPGDTYGARQAHQRHREAEEAHQAAKSAYLDHRINGGPVEDDEEETQEPPRSEGSPTAGPTHT